MLHTRPEAALGWLLSTCVESGVSQYHPESQRGGAVLLRMEPKNQWQMMISSSRRGNVTVTQRVWEGNRNSTKTCRRAEEMEKESTKILCKPDGGRKVKKKDISSILGDSDKANRADS